jgi:hypothetical protein
MPPSTAQHCVLVAVVAMSGGMTIGMCSYAFGSYVQCVCPRVISDCHFAVQLNHFIPGFLSYSVAVILK